LLLSLSIDIDLQIPDKSPDRPSKEEVVALRIGADEEINPDEELDEEQLKEKEEKQEAKHHAQVSWTSKIYENWLKYFVFRF